MSQVVVIGAGVEGLTAALAAAKAGHAVTCVEQRPESGGLAAGGEFAPGFRHIGLWHDADRFSPQLAKELGIALSFRPAPPVVVPRGGQGPISLFADRVEGADEAAFAALMAFVAAVRPVARALLEQPAPAVLGQADLWALARAGLSVRRLGRRRMQELLRVGAQPIADWMGETLVDPALRAALCWEGVVGAWCGPRSPTTAANWLLARCTAGDEVVGGPAALAEALLSAARGAGVSVRVSTRAVGIVVEAGAVRGVAVGDGSVLPAEAVISAIGPRRTLLELVDPWLLPPAMVAEVERVRVRGVLAKVHLALSGAPAFTGCAALPERMRLMDHPDDIERAFDLAKYDALPMGPIPLDVRFPTVSEPGLAPAGQHVASILVHGAAPHPADGWSAAERAALLEAVLQRLEAAAPGARALVVGHEVITPVDVQSGFGLSGGHWLHGELALDQLWSFRPSPATARYSGGLAGLWLAGPGTHPGLPLSGRTGLLAARQLTR